MTDTQSLLYAIGFIVLGFGAMFWNYGVFTVTVLRWSKKPKIDRLTKRITQPKLPFGKAVQCYIPIWQVVVVRKALWKKAPIIQPLMIVSAIFMAIRMFFQFVVYIDNFYFQFATVLMMWVAFVSVYLTYSIVTAKCALMYGFSWLSALLCFVFPWLWCWYLHNNVPTKMRQLYKEDTFNEHTGDTYIKQRNNKRTH